MDPILARFSVAGLGAALRKRKVDQPLILDRYGAVSTDRYVTVGASAISKYVRYAV